ncbi:MAG: hypothetical protein AB1333_04255 [Patescibacteria group bacterium]
MKKGKFIVIESLTCGGKNLQRDKLIHFLLGQGIRAVATEEPSISNNIVGEVIRGILDKQLVSKERIANEFVPVVSLFLQSFLKAPGWRINMSSEATAFLTDLENAQEKVFLGEKLTGREFQTLYVVARYYHLVRLIIPSIDRGLWVISARYKQSTDAYGFGIPLSTIQIWHEEIIGKYYLNPDITFFIDIDPETALNRLKKSGKIVDQFEEKKEFLEKTRIGYINSMAFMDQIYYETRSPSRPKIFTIPGEGSEDEVFELIKEKISPFLKNPQ